jgi:dUTP pyrophosphatase
MVLLVKRLDPEARLPTIAYEGDLAYDIYALNLTILSKYPTLVRTGITVAAFWDFIPRPLGLIVKDRSSMALKGVFTHGGVIDPGYRGELVINMTCDDGYQILPGDKIAQVIPVHVLTGIVQEVENFDVLPKVARGDRGWGSSGR